MIGLYNYDNATEQECLDDLQEVIKLLFVSNLSNLKDLDVLEALKMKGQRIQYIAHRLKELKSRRDFDIRELRNAQTQLVRNDRQPCLDYIVNIIKELGGEKNDHN